jgi:hypothetical protein
VSTAPLDWLLSPAAIDTGLDRKMLAGLLLELARNVDPNVGTEPTGIAPFDPRLEQLRFLLLGREIELSRHFSEVLDDPERASPSLDTVKSPREETKPARNEDRPAPQKSLYDSLEQEMASLSSCSGSKT